MYHAAHASQETGDKGTVLATRYDFTEYVTFHRTTSPHPLGSWQRTEGCLISREFNIIPLHISWSQRPIKSLAPTLLGHDLWEISRRENA